MKRLTLLFVSVLSILLTACKKESKPVDDNYYMKAMQSNAEWSASPSWNFLPLNQADTMEVRGSNESGLLYIRLTRKNQDAYQIDHTQTVYELRTATGVALATYMLSDGSANTVRLSAIDTVNHCITGTFDLNFTKLSGNSDAPAVVTFKNGQFRSRQILAFAL